MPRFVCVVVYLQPFTVRVPSGRFPPLTGSYGAPAPARFQTRPPIRSPQRTRPRTRSSCTPSDGGPTCFFCQVSPLLATVPRNPDGPRQIQRFPYFLRSDPVATRSAVMSRWQHHNSQFDHFSWLRKGTVQGTANQRPACLVLLLWKRYSPTQLLAYRTSDKCPQG